MANVNKIIKQIIGEPKRKEWLFQDSDGDGVINFEDCDPKNPKKQGIIHRAYNWVTGRGYQDIDRQKEIAAKAEAEGNEERARKAQESAQKQEQAMQQREEDRMQKARREYVEQQQKATKERTEYESALKTGDEKQIAKEKKDLDKLSYKQAKKIQKDKYYKQAYEEETGLEVESTSYSPAWDYQRNPGYKLMQEQSSKGGISGAVGTAAKTLTDVGMGTSSKAASLVSPQARQQAAENKELGFKAGEFVGELAMWEGGSKVVGTGIKNIATYEKTAATSTSFAARNVAKAKALAAKGARNVLVSKPVRYLSEGYTGEIYDVGQGYFNQAENINKKIQQQEYLEAAGYLGLGYAQEKVTDKAVGSGFKSSIGKGPGAADAFISGSGSDPRIGRLFEMKPSKQSFAQKVSDFTGIDFKAPDTRVDVRVLEGTKPTKGSEWDLSRIKTKGESFKSTKGTTVDKLDKLDKLDKTDKTDKLDKLDKLDKMDKLDKLDKLDKTDKTKAFDAFPSLIMPLGSIPRGYNGYGGNKYIGGYTAKLGVKNLSEERNMQPIKPYNPFGISTKQETSNVTKKYGKPITKKTPTANNFNKNFNKSMAMSKKSIKGKI